MRREATAKSGGRRKSAFAEEEEGYMFVEESFRIRFGNGEVIDFYADSAADKESWMNVLSQTVDRGVQRSNGPAKTWTDLVLRHESHARAKQHADRLLGRRGVDGSSDAGGESTPLPSSSPQAKNDVTEGKRESAFVKPSPAMVAAASQQRQGHKHTSSQSGPLGSIEARRQKTRSLMF